MSVLYPWTDVKLTENGGGYVINIWGRQYVFDGSLLPTSIISLGKELLQESVALKMDFGKGEEIPYNCRYEVFEASSERVLLNGAALCGNIIVNSTVTIEYDGFMKINLRLVPCGIYCYINDWAEGIRHDTTVMLRSARLSIKVKKEAATLLHYWPNSDYGVLARNVVASGSFSKMDMPFKPTVWFGNEKYGLNFCMESDENIQLTDKTKCITTDINDTYHEVSVQLLNQVPRQWADKEESWARPLGPISYEFMLQATPVKPYQEDLVKEWRVYRGNPGSDNLEEIAGKGAKWMHYHETWSLIQNNCYPENRTVLLRDIEKCHELGMKVMLYFGYEYSSAMPDWDQHKNDYLNKNQEGNFTGGWTRGGMYQKAFLTCYHGGYSEEMIAGAVRAMDELGADGIYTDGTFIPWECANEAHGCGYRDQNGDLHCTYPILAVREHVKKLYEAVHERNGRVDAHQSACCVMPLLAFCDSYWDGENIQEGLAEDLEKHLPLEAFRCEYQGKNFGPIAQLLAYPVPPKYEMRNALALSLIHDVAVRPIESMEMLELAAKVWNTCDAFGKEDALWRPYWENNSAIKAEGEGIYVSTYEKEDKILAFVSKFGSPEKIEEFILPEAFSKAHEVFDDVDYKVTEGRMNCTLASATAYLFYIEK